MNWATSQGLLSGNVAQIGRWVREGDRQSVLVALAWLIGGAGLYGVSLGLGRSPLMGLFTGIKLPLLLLTVLLVNGAFNGMLAALWQTGLSFRQTLHLVLVGFAIFAGFVGALSPVALFFSWTLPFDEVSGAVAQHAGALVLHTGLMAAAGVISVVKLYRVLLELIGSPELAQRVFWAWTLGNLFVGAQLAYNLRPFFGSPGLPIAFLREDPMVGNFYLSFFATFRSFLRIDTALALVILAVLGLGLASWLQSRLRVVASESSPQPKNQPP